MKGFKAESIQIARLYQTGRIFTHVRGLGTHSGESMSLSKPRSHPLFNYTSGRWLWDEETQLQKRYQPFNILKLKEAAARCVEAKSCIGMTKLHEGSYNRAFLLTMDNGVQVVARIPNPYLPPRVATASEVATLDFMRNELDIPTPRVFAWSSDRNQNVEAEYIIMEKAPGRELAKCWPSMDIADRLNIVSQLVSIQAKMASVDFKYYGSLYYRGEPNGRHNIPGISSRFCVGPAAALQFWAAERATFDEYRGPWSSPISYMIDIAKRETNWISQFAKTRDMSDPLRQSTSQESPECHLQLLQKYHEVAPQIIPGDQDLHLPTIWHPDLHAGNIFVENNKIVSIIDWQGCMSLPLFLTCKIPRFLQFNGPLLFDLPPAAGLSAQEKEDNLLRYQLTQLQRFYFSRFSGLDDAVSRALSYPYAITRQQLVEFAGSTWEDDGLFLFREMMHQVWQSWNEITNKPGQSCPITFTADELSSHDAEGKVWDERKAFFESLEIPIDGWIHPEEFQSKAQVMSDLAKAMLNSADDKEETRRALEAWKLTDPGATLPFTQVT